MSKDDAAAAARRQLQANSFPEWVATGEELASLAVAVDRGLRRCAPWCVRRGTAVSFARQGEMGARDHAISHFADMKQFATSLADASAQVVEHSYAYLSFGSWTITFRYRGRPGQVAT